VKLFYILLLIITFNLTSKETVLLDLLDLQNNSFKKATARSMKINSDFINLIKKGKKPMLKLVSNKAKITSYFVQSFKGSKTRTSVFDMPLLGEPRGLIIKKGKRLRKLKKRYKAYYNNLQIYNRSLNPRNKFKVLAFVNAYDLARLQMEGFGYLQVDKKEIFVEYANHNGHAFMPQVSKLRDFCISKKLIMNNCLLTFPHKTKSIILRNPRYIFFKIGKYGVGVKNIRLTRERSVAADLSIYKVGTILYLKFESPHKEKSRFVIVQDTGEAIKGRDHLDMFYGVISKDDKNIENKTLRAKIFELIQ